LGRRQARAWQRVECMNLVKLEEKLLAAARANPPSDRVPYAFEKRVIACLGNATARDAGAFWARALWRAAAPCVGVMLLLSAWSFLGGGNNTSQGDWSTVFENTVLAAANQEASADSLW